MYRVIDVDKCDMRLLLLIATSNRWFMETSNPKSASLQGELLDRTVIITTPEEANVTKGKLWKLKVAMYGLNDASLQIYFKCREDLLSLECSQSTFDSAMFIILNESGDLISMIVLHVDDFLHARCEDFRSKVSRKLEDIFTMGLTEQKAFKCVGFDEEYEEDGIQVRMKTCAEEKRVSKLIRKVNSRESEDEEIPVNAIVDKSTVDDIHSTAPVEDKKLRRDVTRIKQMMNLKEIRSVSRCSGKEQLIDCMTKQTESFFNLMQALKSGRR